MKVSAYESGRKNAFSLYQRVKKECAAYRKFLGSKVLQITQEEQFHVLPLMNKTNYLSRFPLHERVCGRKDLSDFYLICTSSGSTGNPTLWPRDYNADTKLVLLQEKFLDIHFSILRKKTLIVVAFGMGTSTAGILTSKLSWESAPHGKISVITPGVDAEATVRLLSQLCGYYEQTVIIGYPPFIKESIDLAIKKKQPLKRWNIKICYTSENISRVWRQEMKKKLGYEEKETIVAFYACSEAGIIGIETPDTVKIVAACEKYAVFRNAVFPHGELPSIVEVDYARKYIEIVNGEIVLTTDQPVPLVRYNLRDRGMFLSSDTLRKAAGKYGIALSLTDNDKLFLCVYGRNDSPHASVFFVEEIRASLEMSSLAENFTGAFRYKEIIGSAPVIVLEIHTKKRLHITPKRKKELEREMEERLQEIKKRKQFGMAFPVRIEAHFVHNTGREKYKNGKLRYVLP